MKETFEAVNHFSHEGYTLWADIEVRRPLVSLTKADVTATLNRGFTGGSDFKFQTGIIYDWPVIGGLQHLRTVSPIA